MSNINQKFFFLKKKIMLFGKYFNNKVQEFILIWQTDCKTKLHQKTDNSQGSGSGKRHRVINTDKHLNEAWSFTKCSLKLSHWANTLKNKGHGYS